MTARKNFTNYWQLDPGFLSQLTGNSKKLEAQGPIMAKAGTILEEDYDPSVDDDLANLLSGITPNEMYSANYPLQPPITFLILQNEFVRKRANLFGQGGTLGINW